MSATLKESPAPGRHWTPPMDGSKSSFQTNPGPSMTILRLRIAPLRRRFSMPIGCTQSATGSRVFVPTALGFLLDHLSRARLMRRDPTASYSLRVLRIETDDFAVTAVRDSCARLPLQSPGRDAPLGDRRTARRPQSLVSAKPPVSPLRPSEVRFSDISGWSKRPISFLYLPSTPRASRDQSHA